MTAIRMRARIAFFAPLRTTGGTQRHLQQVLPLLWIELLVVGLGTGVGLTGSPFGRRY